MLRVPSFWRRKQGQFVSLPRPLVSAITDFAKGHNYSLHVERAFSEQLKEAQELHPRLDFPKPFCDSRLSFNAGISFVFESEALFEIKKRQSSESGNQFS
jgi:hypothetical protein